MSMKIVTNNKGRIGSMKCCICGNEIMGYGNNARPVMKGTCCDACNYSVVIPKRFQLIHDSRTINKED